MQAEVERDPATLARLRTELASYRRDMGDLMARWDELVASHPDEWVSLHAGRVFVDRTIEGLFAQLAAAGIEPATVPREFLGRDKAPLLL